MEPACIAVEQKSAVQQDSRVEGRDGPHVSVTDLVDGNGTATSWACEQEGQRLTLIGYVVPSLVCRPGRLLITAESLSPCQLCGNIHGAERGLWIETVRTCVPVLSMHDAVRVTGTLRLDRTPEGAVDGLVLVNASLASLTDGESRSRPEAREWLARYVATPETRSRDPRQARSGRRAPSGHDIGKGPADMILSNGRIHTVDEAFSTAQSVAIREGRFVAVGDDEEVRRHAGPGTEIVDLEGRTAIPGLIDSHIHQFYVGLNLPTVPLLEARSVADVQARIAERSLSVPPGDWIVGTSGWHESLLAEGRMPTRWELDEAAPRNPVIIPRGGHVVTVNSLALERAGITDETPDPVGGVIVRDPATGAATGVLLETAAYFARRVAPLLPAEDEMADLLKAAMRELNSYGIVSVIDPVVDETSIAVYRRLRDEGAMTVRTDLLYKASDKAHTERGIKAIAAETGDDMLRFPGIKFMLDGGVEGARLHDPYRIVPGEQPHADYHGLLMTPPGGEEEFVEALELVARAGLQAQTHGVGDEAIDVIVRAYAEVDARVPIPDLRWTLMHAFLPSPEAIETMSRIGILATVQDHPVLLGHNQRRWWGHERADPAIPVRDLIDAGLLVGGGTDGPVVPVDPFLSMWWMVTRQTLLGYAMGPEQAISAREALELYTINNACIMGLEDTLGSIEAGKFADLTVLSQDLLGVDPDEIRNTKALMTMVGGKIVYQRDAV